MYGWYLFTVGLHVLLCIFLVLIILLQPGKGGDVGAAFGGGGGGAQMFGPRGPASYLQRATTGVAILFMVTSVTLALFSTKGCTTPVVSRMWCSLSKSSAASSGKKARMKPPTSRTHRKGLTLTHCPDKRREQFARMAELVDAQG